MSALSKLSTSCRAAGRGAAAGAGLWAAGVSALGGAAGVAGVRISAGPTDGGSLGAGAAGGDGLGTGSVLTSTRGGAGSAAGLAAAPRPSGAAAGAQPAAAHTSTIQVATVPRSIIAR